PLKSWPRPVVRKEWSRGRQSTWKASAPCYRSKSSSSCTALKRGRCCVPVSLWVPSLPEPARQRVEHWMITHRRLAWHFKSLMTSWTLPQALRSLARPRGKMKRRTSQHTLRYSASKVPAKWPTTCDRMLILPLVNSARARIGRKRLHILPITSCCELTEPSHGSAGRSQG